jgi:hypothetical protein
MSYPHATQTDTAYVGGMYGHFAHCTCGWQSELCHSAKAAEEAGHNHEEKETE